MDADCSADKQEIVTTDSLVRIWDLRSGKQKLALASLERARDLAFRFGEAEFVSTTKRILMTTDKGIALLADPARWSSTLITTDLEGRTLHRARIAGDKLLVQQEEMLYAFGANDSVVWRVATSFQSELEGSHNKDFLLAQDGVEPNCINVVDVATGVTRRRLRWRDNTPQQFPFFLPRLVESQDSNGAAVLTHEGSSRLSAD